MSNNPIAFFIPGLNAGGAQKVMVNLANTLVDIQNRPVHMVLARPQGEFLSQLRPEVTVINLNTQRAYRSVWALSRYLRKYRPYVLCSRLNYANVVALMSWLLARRPCRMVVGEANIVRRPNGGIYKRFRHNTILILMRLLYPLADKVVANSGDTLQSMNRMNIYISQKAVVIGNPVIIDKQHNHFKPLEFLPEPPPPFICAIGRLNEQKGFDILLTSFSILKDTKLHLVILGEGPLRCALIAHAERLGLSQRVHLPGFIDNPGAVLQRANAFVLSSRWEGFGNVLVEALACGTPVVAANCPGGPAAILENGKHGYLVSPENPEALAEGIERTLNQPVGTRESRMARASDFSSDKIAREYLNKALLDPKVATECMHID